MVTRPVYESSVTIRPKKEVVKERNEILTLRINFIVTPRSLPNYANNAPDCKRPMTCWPAR